MRFAAIYRLRLASMEVSADLRREHALSHYDMHAKYADVVASNEVLNFSSGLASNLNPNLPQGR